eukprot:TRINITY_DN17870_c0_g1_i1.p1 TRINITY_DN17870_c0_g1~~TRINITY_DN17870_c0_g1_i1.p1  ORF type:complete len:472 (+),score=71.02 TRINITY_DN17870_c0_g1_i1:64-1479(+)
MRVRQLQQNGDSSSKRAVALPPTHGRRPPPFKGHRSLPAAGGRVDAADMGHGRDLQQRHLRGRADVAQLLSQHAAKQQQLRRSIHEACCQCRFLSESDGTLAEAPLAAPVTFVRSFDLLSSSLGGTRGAALAQRGAKIDAPELSALVAAAKDLQKASCVNTCQKMFCLVQMRRFLRGLDRDAAEAAGIPPPELRRASVQPVAGGKPRPSWADAAQLTPSGDDVEDHRPVWCFRCGQGPFVGQRACGACATVLHHGAADNSDNVMYLDLLEHASQRDLVVAQRRTELLVRAEAVATAAAASLLRPQPVAVNAHRTPHRVSLVGSGRLAPDGPQRGVETQPRPAPAQPEEAPQSTAPSGPFGQTHAGSNAGRVCGGEQQLVRQGSKRLQRGRLSSLEQPLKPSINSPSLSIGASPDTDVMAARPPAGVASNAPARQPGVLKGTRRPSRGRPAPPGLAESATHGFVQGLKMQTE